MKIRQYNKISAILSPNAGKRNLKTQLQRYLHVGPACANGLRNEKTKVHQDYSKTYEELITGTLNSLLYARGDAYKGTKPTKPIEI